MFFFKVRFGELPQFLHDIIPNHTKFYVTDYLHKYSGKD